MSAPGNLDVLVPLLFLDGTAVDLKADVVVFDDDVADAGPVAGFRGWPPQRHQLLQFLAAGVTVPSLSFSPVPPIGKFVRM